MSVPREVGVSTFAGRKQGSEGSARKAGPWFLEGTVQPHAHSSPHPSTSHIASRTRLSIISSFPGTSISCSRPSHGSSPRSSHAISASDLGRNPAPFHHFCIPCTCYTDSFPTNLNVTLETGPTGIHPSSQSRNLAIHSSIEATLSLNKMMRTGIAMACCAYYVVPIHPHLHLTIQENHPVKYRHPHASSSTTPWPICKYTRDEARGSMHRILVRFHLLKRCRRGADNRCVCAFNKIS
jgi:hypothetical protein